MGCDIHLYVERHDGKGWTSADEWVREEDDGDVFLGVRNEFYSGRNYHLFAILAGVRNGTGFAGVKTGEGFNPISEPRGIPDDASPEVKAVAAQWGVDGHAHSHLTLSELLDYDWTQTTTLTGWVDAKNFLEFTRSPFVRKPGEGPRESSSGVFGATVRHLSHDEMDAVVGRALARASGCWRDAAEILQAEHVSTYAQVWWETPYYKTAEDFLAHTLPRLLKLAGGIDGANKVRIVFFFDN